MTTHDTKTGLKFSTKQDALGLLPASLIKASIEKTIREALDNMRDCSAELSAYYRGMAFGACESGNEIGILINGELFDELMGIPTDSPLAAITEEDEKEFSDWLNNETLSAQELARLEEIDNMEDV